MSISSFIDSSALDNPLPHLVAMSDEDYKVYLKSTATDIICNRIMNVVTSKYLKHLEVQLEEFKNKNYKPYYDNLQKRYKHREGSTLHWCHNSFVAYRSNNSVKDFCLYWNIPLTISNEEFLETFFANLQNAYEEHKLVKTFIEDVLWNHSACYSKILPECIHHLIYYPNDLYKYKGPKSVWFPKVYKKDVFPKDQREVAIQIIKARLAFNLITST